MLTYGVDDTVLPIDPLNVNFRNFIDNFTDIDNFKVSRFVYPRKSYGGRIQSVIHRFLAQRIYKSILKG
jgi:hypothetical protein